MFGAQRTRHLRGLRTGILDVLPFIENHRQPLDRHEAFADQAQLAVVQHVQVRFAEAIEERVEFARGPELDAQAGREAGGFGVPVVHDGFGADDQGGSRGERRGTRAGRCGCHAGALSIRCAIRKRDALRGRRDACPTGLLAHPHQPGQRLQRFAEAHVIGQNSPEVVRDEVGQEMKTFQLVRAQLRRDALRQVRRHARFDFAGAALDLLDLLFGQKLLGRFIRELERVQALRLGSQLVRVQAEPGQALVVRLGEIELQPPPAFLAEAHKAAFGVEQEFDLLRRERGVGDIQHHAQIEPVDGGLGHVQPDAARDSRVSEGGEVAGELHADVGRDRFEPGHEDLGESLRDAQREQA